MPAEYIEFYKGVDENKNFWKEWHVTIEILFEIVLLFSDTQINKIQDKNIIKKYIVIYAYLKI